MQKENIKWLVIIVLAFISLSLVAVVVVQNVSLKKEVSVLQDEPKTTQNQIANSLPATSLSLEKNNIIINTKIPANYSVQATQEQVDNLIKKYPNWGLQIYIDVAQKAVHVGMTQEQVLEAWGKPQKTSTLNDRGDELWNYLQGNSVTFVGDNVSEIGQ